MTQDKRLTEISKFMSYALRHKPEEAGIRLDPQGWTDVAALVSAYNGSHKKQITLTDVLEVVRTCEKQRYALSEDQTRIRANQGHSVAVDVELVEMQPPAVLYHGTATRFYQSIRELGINKMKRQHVHLSYDLQTALTVGDRHGMPMALKIDAQRMYEDGHKFWRSLNGVWLTEHVAPCYIYKAIKEDA